MAFGLIYFFPGCYIHGYPSLGLNLIFPTIGMHFKKSSQGMFQLLSWNNLIYKAMLSKIQPFETLPEVSDQWSVQLPHQRNLLMLPVQQE